MPEKPNFHIESLSKPDPDSVERQIMEKKSFIQNKAKQIMNGSLIHGVDYEDIAQEALSKALSNSKNFRGESDIKTWLTRIIINEINTIRRKKVSKIEQGADENAELHMANLPSTDIDIEKKLLIKERLEKLINSPKISDHERQLLILRYLKGHSTKEVASMFKMNENTLKIQINRARKKLLGHNRR